MRSNTSSLVAPVVATLLWGSTMLVSAQESATGTQGSSVAASLRAAPKPLTVNDLPTGYRAISLGANAGGFSSYLLFGAFGGRGDSSKPEETVLLSLLDATFVDPDEFEALLDGKRPRIRGYALDLGKMILTNAPGETIPSPIFVEGWIEAGRVTQWSPKSDLTPDFLVKTFGSRATPVAVQSEKTTTLSNAKQMATAIMIYMGDSDDVFPKAESTTEAQTAILPYSKSQEIFKSLNPNGGRLLYNTHLSRVKATTLERPAETILIWDERAWPDGTRIVAYADSHAKVLSQKEWETAWTTELARREQVRRAVRPR